MLVSLELKLFALYTTLHYMRGSAVLTFSVVQFPSITVDPFLVSFLSSSVLITNLLNQKTFIFVPQFKLAKAFFQTSNAYLEDGPGIWSINIQLYTQNLASVHKFLADEYLFREHEC